MLQVFHMDVAKVDRDIAMVVYICCKLLFLMFHLFFQAHVASMFIWMLHMFHIYVSSVFIWMLRMFLQWFSGVFISVSDPSFKCFICL
jgi:hypothetical protein